MRLDTANPNMSDAQKRQAKIGGIPADRPGLGAEYPKMIYRPGKNERHKLLDAAVPIGNGAYDPRTEKLGKGTECETAYVDSYPDELLALADGWFLSPSPEEQGKAAIAMLAERAKDDEIALLRAELAAVGSGADAPRRGRPPKDLTTPV